MSVLSRLTVTPLLWACGLLLVAVAVLGVRLYVVGAKVDAAQAATEAAEARAAQAATERDAWKGAADTALAANAQWQQVHDRMRQLLQHAQGEARRLEAAGQAAVAAAQAEAAEADRTLSTWMTRYADQVRVGSCAAALRNVQQACPAFEGF